MQSTSSRKIREKYLFIYIATFKDVTLIPDAVLSPNIDVCTRVVIFENY